MDIEAPTVLLGGLSPQQFMQRYWQKKPLLVRQAWPGVLPPVSRAQAFKLAAHPDMEVRVVQQKDPAAPARHEGWSLQRGPLPRRALPPAAQPRWTLLLQGLDLQVPAAHDMLRRFRFVPDALLDDVMLSWASEGGGVGPHTDAYDVFLLQVHGQRRWRVGRVPKPQWAPDAPLKRLRNFKPTLDWVLEPGDMLYLPPLWGHDGVAVGGDCMTCSIGFKAPQSEDVARELLQRLSEEDGDGTRAAQALYRHAGQGATATPGALPQTLHDFAQAAVLRHLAQPQALARVLGEWATEPKPQVWFEAGTALRGAPALVLHARTRMMHDAHHVFINGEAFAASGADARLMRRLADERTLSAAEVRRLSADARALLSQWSQAGWVAAAPAAGAAP